MFYSETQKEKIKIRNEIYSSYKNAFPESQRTLQQNKKRQQNLEYEYKHLKQRTQKTEEAGIKIIKDGFPYFDYFDEVMGHRDCVNPTKMAVEGSSIFTSTEQKGGSVESKDVPEESSPPASNPSTHSGKKKADDKPAEKGCCKEKRRRRDEPEPSYSGLLVQNIGRIVTEVTKVSNFAESFLSTCPLILEGVPVTNWPNYR